MAWSYWIRLIRFSQSHFSVWLSIYGEGGLWTCQEFTYTPLSALIIAINCFDEQYQADVPR